MNVNILKQQITHELMSKLQNNCPVRTKPLGKIKYSPYPGNLRQNGINMYVSGDNAQVIIGGDVAIYGPITEYTSHRKGWIQKSVDETIEMCKRLGGRVE